MRLNVKAMALTLGLMWGATVFFLGVGNLMWPPYAERFLEIVSSVYPGYSGGHSLGQVIIGTLYACLDGAIAGAVVAWLYNRLAPR